MLRKDHQMNVIWCGDKVVCYCLSVLEQWEKKYLDSIKK